jgi:hypothetical protein
MRNTASFLLIMGFLILANFAHADNASKYMLGSEVGDHTYWLYSITYPESAMGTKKCDEAANTCTFTFDKSVDATFRGKNGGISPGQNGFCEGKLHFAESSFSESFKVKSLDINSKYFSSKIILAGINIRFNTALLDEKDKDKMGCSNGLCTLYFNDGDVKKLKLETSYKSSEWRPLKGVKVGFDSVSKEELKYADELWVLCAEADAALVKATTIKINGEALDVTKAYTAINHVEFDFGDQLVPLVVKTNKDKKEGEKVIAKEGTSTRFVTGILIEDWQTLNKPKQEKFLTKINKIISGKGTVAEKTELIKKAFLLQLHDSIKKDSTSISQFYIMVPNKGSGEYGLNPTDMSIIFNENSNSPLPNTKVNFKAESALGGLKKVNVTVKAKSEIYPKMMELAQSLKKTYVINGATLPKIEWPKEMDTGFELKTTELLSKEYIYEKKNVDDTTDITSQIKKLQNGEYQIWAETPREPKDKYVADLQMLLISDQDEPFQFIIHTNNTKTNDTDAVIFSHGKKTTFKFVGKADKIGQREASIQVNGEEKCDISLLPCTLALEPNKNNEKPFYRLISGDLLMLVMQSPVSENEIVVTIVPLGEGKVNVIEKIEMTDVIKNVRVLKGGADVAPIRAKYPVKFQRGEKVEFTQVAEKLAFDMEFDQKLTQMIFEVFGPLPSQNSVYIKTHQGSLYKVSAQADYTRKNEAAYVPKIETFTEKWLGLNKKGEKVAEGEYLVRVKLCTKSKVDENTCEKLIKPDEMQVTVKHYEEPKVTAVASTEGQAKIDLKGAKPGDTFHLQAQQGNKVLAQDPFGKLTFVVKQAAQGPTYDWELGYQQRMIELIRYIFLGEGMDSLTGKVSDADTVKVFDHVANSPGIQVCPQTPADTNAFVEKIFDIKEAQRIIASNQQGDIAKLCDAFANLDSTGALAPVVKAKEDSVKQTLGHYFGQQKADSIFNQLGQKKVFEIKDFATTIQTVPALKTKQDTANFMGEIFGPPEAQKIIQENKEGAVFDVLNAYIATASSNPAFKPVVIPIEQLAPADATAVFNYIYDSEPVQMKATKQDETGKTESKSEQLPTTSKTVQKTFDFASTRKPIIYQPQIVVDHMTPLFTPCDWNGGSNPSTIGIYVDGDKLVDMKTKDAYDETDNTLTAYFQDFKPKMKDVTVSCEKNGNSIVMFHSKTKSQVVRFNQAEYNGLKQKQSVKIRMINLPEVSLTSSFRASVSVATPWQNLVGRSDYRGSSSFTEINDADNAAETSTIAGGKTGDVIIVSILLGNTEVYSMKLKILYGLAYELYEIDYGDLNMPESVISKYEKNPSDYSPQTYNGNFGSLDTVSRKN